ncbi:TM0106 family RecB-like putative nuclease [Candidatus Uhrbacteria bacterium]|nr:TM0106 family RecB-like putative nuclease [Candidatus Uhrbacteria bacterium]
MAYLSEKHFYAYAACPLWVARDVRLGERELAPLLQTLHTEGLLPEVKRRVMERAKIEGEEVEEEDVDEAAVKTVRLMEQGVAGIFRGALVHGHFAARPDVLVRVQGRSRFGDYYYVAGDIRRARKLERNSMLAAAFYADVLLLLQGAKPTSGYQMTPEGHVRSFPLAPFEKEYHLSLHHIERILAGEEPSEFLSSRCKQSPWFPECRRVTEECDALSRINRIWQEESEAITAAGFLSVEVFAKTPHSLLRSRVKNVSPERLGFLHQQAQALVSGRHILLATPELTPGERVIYFDIESDPLRDVEFLFGVLDPDGAYHGFLARKPAAEEEAWNAFVEFTRQYPRVPIYHYGWYESDTVRRMADTYHLSVEERDALLARMRDLLPVIRTSVIFPLSFYSLKDISAYLGFHYRTPEAAGTNAILWYEDWLAFGDEKKLHALLEYNEDDVRATKLVYDWLAVQNV